MRAAFLQNRPKTDFGPIRSTLIASVSPDEKSLTLLLVPFIVAGVLKKFILHTPGQTAPGRKAPGPGRVRQLRRPLNR